jgi:hypothetical protein
MIVMETVAFWLAFALAWHRWGFVTAAVLVLLAYYLKPVREP